MDKPLIEAFEQIVGRRHSNRVFDANIEVPDEIIENALEQATLSPNSSNMQLWEFHWIAAPALKAALAPLCLGQSAARTAKHLVVFVTRQGLWPARAKWNAELIKASLTGEPNKGQKMALDYYQRLMPLVYRNDFLGLSTLFRRTVCFFMGLRKPFMRLGGKAEQRIMVHKSCALAAQTFMLAIAAADFDTCPMEGFDAKRAKALLKLPADAEIGMIVAVGKGTAEGIYNPRNRVPLAQVIIKH
jgi:nitroreductase